MPSWKKLLLAAAAPLLIASDAAATPVCTDGYKGGPPLALCGGRIFPEATNAFGYVQIAPYPVDEPLAPEGFREYQHGIEFLAQKYPDFVSITRLSDVYGPSAVTVGLDGLRPGEEGDTGDGHEIPVLKITDHRVPDAGKKRLFFSLSIHGNERGGLEGGLRTAEDLAMGATQSAGQPYAYIPDGYDNYTSTTGKRAKFTNWPVSELLENEVLYLVDVNVDGWASGDWLAPGSVTPFAPGLYSRGNSLGTDLNRQMPTKGSINTSRNPLKEPEGKFIKAFIDKAAAEGEGGLLDYGADIHGELTSQAYVDVMYPAGQFDSMDHRRLMDMAERTKSVIDKTLYAGIQDQIEEASGGNEAEGALKEPSAVGLGLASAPTKPAHWATVWDTLGYTDTGFLGDYLAADAGVTGMDYEIWFNHTVPEKVWTVYLQENHINASRGIIKTAMAYAMTMREAFNEDNVDVATGGRPGYVLNPETVTNKDGTGTRPGPSKNGVGADGLPVKQTPYEVTNQQWFRDENRYLEQSFVPLKSADVAADGATLDAVDSLVLADKALPKDADGRAVDAAAYYANLQAWVKRGGNLVLTDGALHALAPLQVVPATAVKDVKVYQPYANITDFSSSLVEGLRSNARQLVEAAILGYGIGNSASPMTVVAADAWTEAGGAVVGTTGNGAGTSDDGSQVSLGTLKLGAGQIQIIGGALPTPTETNDHRFGLRDYAPTTSGTFILENALFNDAPGLGEGELAAPLAAARAADLACTEQRVALKTRRDGGPLTGSCAAAVHG